MLQQPRIQEENEIVGLVPAGGQSKRMENLPLSKELFPVGFQAIDGENLVRPKVVSYYLLEKYRKAGITKTYIVLREGKWDFHLSLVREKVWICILRIGSFGTIRHRTARTKGCLTRAGMLHMMFKLGQCGSEKTWRRLRGFKELPKVMAGVQFSDGIEQATTDSVAA